MTDDADLVHIVKRRLDGSRLMCHLTARHQFHEKALGGAEMEVSRLMSGMKDDVVALSEASVLFKAKTDVVKTTALLRAFDREIAAHKDELRDLERLIEMNRTTRSES